MVPPAAFTRQDCFRAASRTPLLSARRACHSSRESLDSFPGKWAPLRRAPRTARSRSHWPSLRPQGGPFGFFGAVGSEQDPRREDAHRDTLLSRRYPIEGPVLIVSRGWFVARSGDGTRRRLRRAAVRLIHLTSGKGCPTQWGEGDDTATKGIDTLPSISGDLLLWPHHLGSSIL